MRGVDWVPIVLNELNITECISNEEFFQRWEDTLASLIDQVELMPGAADVVAYFKSLNVHLAVATSSYTDSFNKKREKHRELFDKFEVFVCGDDVQVCDNSCVATVFTLYETILLTVTICSWPTASLLQIYIY